MKKEDLTKQAVEWCKQDPDRMLVLIVSENGENFSHRIIGDQSRISASIYTLMLNDEDIATTIMAACEGYKVAIRNNNTKNFN